MKAKGKDRGREERDREEDRKEEGRKKKKKKGKVGEKQRRKERRRKEKKKRNMPFLSRSLILFLFFSSSSAAPLCLGNEPAGDAVLAEIINMIDLYNIDYIVQDGEDMVTTQMNKKTRRGEEKEARSMNQEESRSKK